MERPEYRLNVVSDLYVSGSPIAESSSSSSSADSLDEMS